MENQHRLIRGYRDLSQEEIDTMNKLKALANTVGDACLDVRAIHLAMPHATVEERAEREEAMRWLDSAEMQLQQGFMALIRSVARPASF